MRGEKSDIRPRRVEPAQGFQRLPVGFRILCDMIEDRLRIDSVRDSRNMPGGIGDEKSLPTGCEPTEQAMLAPCMAGERYGQEAAIIQQIEACLEPRQGG